MKRLLIDIETAPHLAAVWGIFKENIPLDRLLESGYTMCWAAKWYGTDDVMYDSVHRNDSKTMIHNVHALLEEADAVIHYNGRSFDIPTLNKEFLALGLTPPSPYKQIDLLETARRQFRFPSNKLDYVSKFLGIGTKLKHKGYDLWQGCMSNDKESWKQMTDYNIQDVLLLEKLYTRLLPWIDKHPNVALYDLTEEPKCPHCGSSHVVKKGLAYTQVGIYQRYKCGDCGTNIRSRKMEKVDRESLLVPAR